MLIKKKLYLKSIKIELKILYKKELFRISKIKIIKTLKVKLRLFNNIKIIDIFFLDISNTLGSIELPKIQ